jgi:chloramphenicol 3-O phosphotransferase
VPSDVPPAPGRRERLGLPPVSRGRLVILNGTSSAGKTTLGRAVQDVDAAPWILTGVDHYWSRLPRRYLEDEIGNPDGFRSLYEGEGEARRTVGFVVGPTFRRLMYGLHRTVAALVEAGNDVLVDYLPFDEAMARDAVAVWADLDGVLVAVRPPLEVSERWERERGDRDLGQARVMFEQAHSFGRFDLVVDTSAAPAEAAAGLVLAHLRLAEPATALALLHRRMFGGA